MLELERRVAVDREILLDAERELVARVVGRPTAVSARVSIAFE